MLTVEQEIGFAPPSFAREGSVIKELATTAGPTKQFIIGQAQTWLDALRLFRGLENRIGLPRTQKERETYFMLLSVLLSAGEYLASKLDGKDRILLDLTGLSKEAFDGCVEVLRESRDHLNRGMTSEESTTLLATVFDAPTAA